MTYNFKTIEEAPIVSGTKVLLRLDLNLPIIAGKVQGDFRITRSLPTLNFLKARAARTVILAHTDSKETDSLRAVAEYLKKFVEVEFVETIAELPERLTALRPGGFLFLENLRRNLGEEANDETFAKMLASLGEVYINDAFAVSHRKHASVVGIPKFLPSFAGFLLQDEISHLSTAFNPSHPFVFILAGDKFETKLPLVNKFLGLADTVFIGGALANDLFKAKGYEIGRSKHSPRDFGFKDIVSNPKVMIPTDVDVEVSEYGLRKTVGVSSVVMGEAIYDAGMDSVIELGKKIAEAKFVLWNGTLGAYEKGFTRGTELLAQAIAQSKAHSIVGGGDTLSTLSKLGLMEKFSFVSTGGGAMLEFLATETLPGIEALENSK